MISVLATGDWASTQLQLSWVDHSRATNPAIDHLIEQSWTSAIARRGIKLFDGKMSRLESWHATPDRLQLKLSQTSYKIFLGTNLTHPEVATTHGREVMANPLGLSAAVVTADGWLIFGRRNATVAYYPSRIHPFAGCLEPGDGVDVFAAMRRELAEELGLGAEDIADIHCRGIVEDPALLQPELVFRVQSTRTRAQIEQRVDAGEHDGSWAIANTPAAIAMASEEPELTPVAVGTLMLCGEMPMAAG